MGLCLHGTSSDTPLPLSKCHFLARSAIRATLALFFPFRASSSPSLHSHSLICIDTIPRQIVFLVKRSSPSLVLIKRRGTRGQTSVSFLKALIAANSPGTSGQRQFILLLVPVSSDVNGGGDVSARPDSPSSTSVSIPAGGTLTEAAFGKTESD